MTYTSTRSELTATADQAILRGLAPDGGLFVPLASPDFHDLSVSLIDKHLPSLTTLKAAEDFVLQVFFPDVPQHVRDDAVARMLGRFPAADPTPLVKAGDVTILELFHGPTGAFKDVALSMLPTFMAHAANGRRVLVLTATSGDTGSASMAGFADCPNASVAVFFPNVGTSRIQRLQMTTPTAKNVHAFAIRGNFDDAQTAVKRIFASAAIRHEAEAAGVLLSSANSINIGRLVPQVAYYLHSAARIGRPFDVAVPSGNFGNILAAYYAKLLGAPIGTFICASNANRVLDNLIETGIYDPRPELIVTNSPSMDIRRSSNVERLLWLLHDQDPKAVVRLFSELADKGTYHLGETAFKRLRSQFVAGSATPAETEAEMKSTYESTGYLPDPHTAVALHVARKLGFPKSGRPLLVAATATPYKFPETCLRAIGKNVLTDPPPSFKRLETAVVTQKTVVDISGIDDAVKSVF